MTARTLVIAATNVLARGFLVVPTDRKSRDGEPVNGLFAVARAVLHVVAWKRPARAVAIVDRRGRDWHEQLLPQLAQLPDVLRDLGVSVVEADHEPQLVASYARASVEAGDDVVVVGVDKRFAQLVSETVWWYDANKDARYTPEIVKKRFGVEPRQVGDWLALVGDDDQLPGASGVGAKGATQLLVAYGTVEAALGAESLEGRVRKALGAARDELDEHLANARLDGARPLPRPLADCAFCPPQPAALNARLESLGFAGQGASALALQLGVSAADAKQYIARFDRHYAKVRAFQDEQLHLAKTRGFLVTLAGRRWPIGGLTSLDSQVRSYAERMARRGTHEGSVADVARRALLHADRALRSSRLRAAPLVEVVDEVLFEVAESELAEAAELCANSMRHAFELEVPLVVGVEAGRNWADLQPVTLSRSWYGTRPTARSVCPSTR
jgi:5'-3' exonuclease